MSARVRNPTRPGGLTLPSIPELAGAASGRVDLVETPPWQAPPDWWPPASSVNEWACYWWLTQPPRNYVEGLHFRRQVAVESVGLFTGKPFTRIDFLFKLHGVNAVGSAPGDYDWLGWDPITPFSHPDPALDHEKREILANNDHPNKLALIWIDPIVLAWPDAVLPAALRGVDLSDRARGW